MANLAWLGQSTLKRSVVALRYPEYRHLWLANLSAQAAAWALIVTRGWLVFDMTGSMGMVGAVTFVAMAPLFFVPPLIGVLADRWDRRSLLAWTYAINLAHNLALAVLALTGALETWHILALSLVNGVARAGQVPVSQALAADLVPREKLLSALSLTAATQHGSRLVGPGLAAPLLSVFGAPAAFCLCTAFYAIGWVQVLRIKTRSTGGARLGESLVASFAQGLKYAFGHPMIRMVIVMVIFHCGLTMAFESLLPGFSSKRLNAGAAGFSTMMMAVGAGALAGSVLVGGVEGAAARGRVYLITALVSGLGQVMLALTGNMGLAMLAAAIMGAAQAAFMTLGQAITQTLAADEFRGRIASINTFSLGGVMSGMNLVNGLLGNQFNVASILFIQGLAFVGIVVASVALATPRRVYLQGLPEEAERTAPAMATR